MPDAAIHTLVASSNRGRYALDTPDGRDLTGGDAVAILLGSQWIAGSVEHAGGLYVSASTGQAERGYYFLATHGSVCGLCTGMQVRIR